jgi:hypothetical protein
VTQLYYGTSSADANTLRIRKGSGTIEFYEGDLLRVSETWSLTATSCYVYLEAHSGGTTGTAIIDTFFPRKLVSPEPTHGDWGAEEIFQSATLPPTVGTYYWRARTWDNHDAVGPYSAGKTIIVDRIKITGMGNDDGRRDVGTTGLFWATAVLESDNHPLGSGDSLTISGKSMTWSTGNSRFEATDSRSIVQAVTYNTFTSGYEANYGITAGNMNGYSTTIIWDRFKFVSIAEDTVDQRINVGGTFELRYQIRYDYDNAIFDSSKGSISGFTWDSGNIWWDKTVTGSSSVTSTNYDETYISITDSAYGLTVKQDVAGVNVITDRIRLDSLGLTDPRINANGVETSTLYATASLEYGGHALGSGDSLTISGLALSWVAGNSRFEGTTASSSSVTSTTYNTFTSGNEATYGITVGNMNGQTATLIFDRIKITVCGMNDVIDTRTGGQVWYKAIYEYDSAPFTGSSGTLYLNGTAMIWENNCWTYAFPYQMSGNQAIFHITSVVDTTYGLTSVSNVAGDIVLNWATMEINVVKPETKLYYTQSTAGVSVNITGSVPDGANITVTSTYYGTTQPFGTGALQVGVAFYDVKISSDTPLGSNATANIYFTNPAFSTQNFISFWNGNSWVIVDSHFISPNTICGIIPVSALTGTPIMVGKAPQTGQETFPYIGIPLAVVMVVASSFLVRRARKKRRSSINQF